MSTAIRPASLAPLNPPPRSPEGRVERRRALYRLAAPVAVLTVRHGDELHGTTVSALSTVSREPLLLAACLRSSSEFAALAVQAGRYTVNVLGSDQADLARYFSDGSRPSGAAQFAPWSWTTDPYAQAPLLEGALAHYTCRLAGQAARGLSDLGEGLKPDEVELQLSIRLDAELGAILVKSGAEAQLQVTFRWTPGNAS